MIDHISIEAADLTRAISFYDTVLAPLGYARMVTRDVTAGYGKRHPEFWINQRDGGGSSSASGFHVALRCPDKGAVHGFHEAAIAGGGVDDGAPGLRPEYSDSYYAAFIRDLDGNRIEAVTFLEAGSV